MKPPYENVPLLERARNAIALQEKGCFLVASANIDYGGLPFPHYEKLGIDPYYRKTAWGYFEYNADTLCYVLMNGQPPSELLPQPHLQLAEATLYPGVALVHLGDQDAEVPIQAGMSPDRILYYLNRILYNDGLSVVVWKLHYASNPVQVTYLTNDSAMLYAGSAAWSPQDQHLVAAFVATPSAELLQAIRATLSKNSGKSWITLRPPEGETVSLQGAKKGYITISSSLAKANAQGTTAALLHPLSGNPADFTEDHFFVVATAEDELAALFAQRLDLAVPWPIQVDWAQYLFDVGQQNSLVEVLPQTGAVFHAVRVTKDEDAWMQVIASGLQEGRIAIQTS